MRSYDYLDNGRHQNSQQTSCQLDLPKSSEPTTSGQLQPFRLRESAGTKFVPKFVAARSPGEEIYKLPTLTETQHKQEQSAEIGFMISGEMADKTKRLLVLLLILLKETGPTAAHSCSCSWYCSCSNRGLSSVPQDLPTSITSLTLSGNYITTLSQSDFSRYSSLTTLQLQYNQISVINSGAFYSLTVLTKLWLSSNELPSLRKDTFVGLDSLQILRLNSNNIHSIEAGAFNATPQLRELWLRYNNIVSITAGVLVNLPRLQHIDLSDNDISTFPVEALSNLNTSGLGVNMNSNQMETLPSAAYDLLASIANINIGNNPWQCDCRMLPFKQRMNGSYPLESQITCAGPSNLQGQLLLAVSPEDLICEETSTTQSTPSGGIRLQNVSVQNVSVPNVSPWEGLISRYPSQEFSFSAFLSGFLGGVVGSLLSSAVSLAIWYRITRKVSPAAVPAPAPDARVTTRAGHGQPYVGPGP
ncbi:hypothetical protein Bbelb_383260 [Branchiostoma belcheri]|nr:hypothetical protein Bbelb_383260 [Branchiostoma belcheri]